MLPKIALALAAPFVMSATIPETITTTHHPDIALVDCIEGTGTAFKVGQRGWLSVDHVTKMTGCRINGEPISVTLADAPRDFSSLRMGDAPGGIRINCDGFRDGETYYAVGHARGLPVQRMIAVRASAAATRAFPWRDFTTMVGAEYFIPGMSGGPVLNAAGEAVGLVNGLNRRLGLSFSQSLSTTPACTGNK